VTFEQESRWNPSVYHKNYEQFPADVVVATAESATTTNEFCENSAGTVLKGLEATDFTIPYQLASSVAVDAFDTNVLTMYITDADVIRIKERKRLARNFATAWLLVTNTTVTDMSGNFLVPIQDGTSTHGGLNQDATVPLLQRWGGGHGSRHFDHDLLGDYEDRLL
jgi:hypothetical protein